MNNTLLIQATAQEYEGIQQLIRELDVPPRQVLIEAKIYSVDLNSATSSDIHGALQVELLLSAATPHRRLVAGESLAGGTTTLSAAMVVGKSRELLGQVTLMESAEQRQNHFVSLGDCNRQHPGIR